MCVSLNIAYILALKSPAKINSLLLSPKDAATDENSVIKALFVRLVFLVVYIYSQ